MNRVRAPFLAGLASAVVALVCLAEGCGSKGAGGSGFDQPAPGSPVVYASDANDDSAFSATDDGPDPNGVGIITALGNPDAARPPPPVPTCKLPGLWCYQTMQCTTTLSGTVYDPAGKNPLYNVVVYVPSDPSMPLPKITPGTSSCDSCDAKIGDYMAVAVTDANGHFSMTDVPATTNVPVVVQIGKWRREVYLSEVKACQDNPVKGNDLRLPRNQKEGDMPQMALLTGGCDDLGCFMRGIGIDANEFTAPQGGGRLDIYQGNGLLGAAGLGGLGTTAPGLSNGTAGNCTTAADAGGTCPLWASKQSLEYYDLVFLACECDENNQTKPPASMQAMHDWLGEGGKVFATHFHYTWFKNGPSDFQGLANWLGPSLGIGAGTYNLDTSFPKGMTLQKWLNNVGALSGTNSIMLNGVANSVSTVNNPPVTEWIYDPNSAMNSEGGSSTGNVKYMSFLTPIGGIPGAVPDGGGGDSEAPMPQYCGKAVFTDLHTSGAPSGDVPAACSSADLTAQQKALEFFLFDLAACVAPENRPPPTPPAPPPPPPPPPM